MIILKKIQFFKKHSFRENKNLNNKNTQKSKLHKMDILNFFFFENLKLKSFFIKFVQKYRNIIKI